MDVRKLHNGKVENRLVSQPPFQPVLSRMSNLNLNLT
jgi:hypothetical protein